MIRVAGARWDLVVDIDLGVPIVMSWGARLDDVDAIGLLLDRPLVPGSPDVVAPLSVVPEHGAGFPGRPGLSGHRHGGRHWAPRFRPAGHHVTDRGLVVTAEDPDAELTLITTFELDDALVVTIDLRNDSPTERYLLDGLTVTLPVPERAAELATFTGRWTREFHPVRDSWTHGARTAENRRGRTSHEYPAVVFAGTPGFSEWSGEVWGMHLAWSGNHSWFADRLPDGRRFVQMGELLHPGEICLEPGESYRTPEVIAVHGAGLTPATQQFHRHLRQRPGHPTTPRPVLINTWEAVYFDHDLDVLRRLADRAARVGIERFVLDDGWFGSRRDDTTGLGDWVVSSEVYPDGLGPLIDHVIGLGMDFGIWVEPEMVNPDSELHRTHPDWALAGADPVLARNQLVLDLTEPAAYHHVLDRLDALLSEHAISYMKWDMNRDHIGASRRTGVAGTHSQTLAVYRLLDELRQRHPHVEIESCSSGGGRVDHEILRRVVRVWTSDCNDPLERQTIQRGASMFIPPEVMGAHIGPRRSATTGRRHDLAFRAATALFGHLGVEWNLLTATEHELDELSELIALHRRLRPLLHGGEVVRFDSEPSLNAHGVYAADRSEAVVSVARLTTGPSLTPHPIVLPDLDPDGRYEVRLLDQVNSARSGPNRSGPSWVDHGVTSSGSALASIGLQLPAIHPESAVLLHLLRT